MKPFVGFVILTFYVLGLFVLGILIALLSDRVCERENCKEISKLWRKTLEVKASHCENFYKSVCGSGNNTEAFSDLLERNQLLRVIQDLKVHNKGHEPAIFHQMREAYQGCVDLDKIEREGMRTVLEVMEEPPGFPLLYDEDQNRLPWNMIYKLWCVPFAEVWAHRRGFHTAHFIKTYVHNYTRGKRTQLLPYFSIPGSLQNDINTYNNTKYLNYVLDVIKAFNRSKKLTEADYLEINRVVKFRANLLQLANAVSKDKSTKNDTIKNFDILDTYTNLNIEHDSFAKPVTLGLTLEMKANEYLELEEVVYGPGVEEYLVGLDQLMSNTSKETAANYVAIQQLMQVTPVLPRELRKAYVKHFGRRELESRPLFKDRQLYCAKLVKEQATTAYSALYIRSHPPEEWAENDVIYDVAEQIKKQAGMLINKMEWMDKKTKTRLEKKLNSIKFTFPLPKNVIKDLANDTLLRYFYQHFCSEMSPSVLKNYLSLGRAKSLTNSLVFNPKRNWSTFNEEHDIVSLNLHYDKERNTIIVPFGVLHFPAFQPEWPQYLNYGGVGVKIAQEILSALGFPSTKYEMENKENDLWSERTKARYKEKIGCFLRQYNEYVNSKTKKGKGTPECAEPLFADRAAADLTFRGYSAFKKNRFWHERRLPMLQTVSPVQYLFMSFSSFYCSEEPIRSPCQEYRVLSSLKNFDEFSKTFDCRKDDKMNPSKKCSIL